MDDVDQLELVTMVSEYERRDSITPEGEGIINQTTKLREFYASESSINEILKGVFYEKAN